MAGCDPSQRWTRPPSGQRYSVACPPPPRYPRYPRYPRRGREPDRPEGAFPKIKKICVWLRRCSDNWQRCPNTNARPSNASTCRATRKPTWRASSDLPTARSNHGCNAAVHGSEKPSIGAVAWSYPPPDGCWTARRNETRTLAASRSLVSRGTATCACVAASRLLCLSLRVNPLRTTPTRRRRS